jgi:hypothetical protein
MMEFKLVTMLGALCLSAVLMSFAHAYDWRRVFGRKLSPPWNYVAGLLFLAIPYTVLMALWRDWWALGAAVAVVMGGGFPVIFGYNVRGKAQKQDYEAIAMEELEADRGAIRRLRSLVDEQDQDIQRLMVKLRAQEASHDR